MGVYKTGPGGEMKDPITNLDIQKMQNIINEFNKTIKNKQLANTKAKFRGAVGKIGGMKAFVSKKNTVNKMNTINENPNQEKKAVNENANAKLSTSERFKRAGVNIRRVVSARNKMKPKMTNNPLFNNKPKMTNNPLFNNKPNEKTNTWNASAELNQQLNIKGKALNKANTNKKIRNGVEFKIKQINGLTNVNVAEFMTKWNSTKNPFTRKGIFNQARKRGEGRLKGKKVKNERNKPKEENNFNASAAINKLNMAPKKNSLMKKAKNEVGRFAGRIGKWDPAIKNATNNATLLNLEKQMNKKIELRKEIQMSKIGPIKKRGHLEKVMQLKNNVVERRRIFEEQLANLTKKDDQKISNASKSLVSGAINGVEKREKFRKVVKFSGLPQNRINTYMRISNIPNFNYEKRLEDLKRNIERHQKNKMDKAATKIQATFRGKKNRNMINNKKSKEGEISATALTPKAPNVPQPIKPSFRTIVQKNKDKRVLNSMKLAAKKTALARASGPERIKMARNMAPRSMNNVKKAKNAAEVFKPKVRNEMFKTKGISYAKADKAESGRVKAAAEKAEKRAEVQKTLETQKRKAEALKAKRAEALKVFKAKRVETEKAAKLTDIDRIKRAGETADAKRKLKSEQRKKNKLIAKSTGQSVKSTQKKQQLKRKSSPKR